MNAEMAVYCTVVHISHMIFDLMLCGFASQIYEKRYGVRTQRIAVWISTFIAPLIVTVNQLFAIYSGVMLLVENLLQLGLLHMLYKGKLRGKILLVLFLEVFYLYLDYFFLLIFDYFIADEKLKNLFITAGWLRTAYLILFTICFTILSMKLFQQKELFRTLMTVYRMPLWVLSVSCYLLAKYFQRIYSPVGFAFWNTGSFWYWLFLASIIFISAMLHAKTKEQLQRQAILIKSETYERSCREMQGWYQEHSILLHDTKKHLAAIRSMVEAGVYDKALSYIDTLQEPFLQMSRRAKTGVGMLDLLLDAKAEEAKRKRIPFQVMSEYLPALEIADVDVCAIFGNLLDNALEACCRQEGNAAYIAVRVSQKQGFLLFDIRNSMAKKPQIQDGMMISSKEDKKLHGLGLLSVQKYVKKNGGFFHCEVAEQEFCAMVMLPLAMVDANEGTCGSG